MTTLPIAGLPVKKMWSNGSSSSACDTAASPSNSATSSSAKTSPTSLAIAADRWGVISDGLMMAVLPAAIAETSGPKVRFSG